MEKECSQCHIKFSKPKYCSKKKWNTKVKTCSIKCKYASFKGSRRTAREIECFICKKIVIHSAWKIKRAKKSYCSNECKRLGKIGVQRPDMVGKGFKKGMTPWNKGKAIWVKKACQHCNKEFKHYLKKDDLTYGRGKYCSRVCKFLSFSKTHSGENHYNWRGGITPDNHKVRTSMEYKNWRVSVFERDDYTCQECGKRGGILNADHIKPFAYFIDLRFELSNGRTLCVPCHRMTDSYGNKARLNYGINYNNN